MLVVFNLGWKDFDIDQKAGAATRKMNALASEKGAGHFVIFNLASLGAGEKATGFLTPESERPSVRTMDYLRRRHWRVARDLNTDKDFQAYRDAAEMLQSLKKQGHSIAAVLTGPTKTLESDLKKARVLDFFEDAVYGADRTKEQDSNPEILLRAVYLHALQARKIAPSDSIVVSDHPAGVGAAKPIHPAAIAGYLNPYQQAEVIDSRLNELKSAGAHYAVCGGHSISTLPAYLFAKRGLQASYGIIAANRTLQ